MFYDLYDKLCKEKGVSRNKAAVEIGLSNSTVTKWKKTQATPNGETLAKIARYFNVSVDYLMSEEAIKKERTPAPGLTAKDERDIQKQLEKTLQQLEGEQGALMFDGEPMDDITKELLIASLRNSMEIGKRLAKEKFTPKKYRK